MTRIPDPRTRARRSVSGPICASRWLLVCLLGAVAACLNPFPDDQPQSRDAVPVSQSDPGATGSPAPETPPADNGANFEDGESSNPNEPQGAPPPDAGVEPAMDAGPDAMAPVIQ
jgi:hypothetical protein